jgi:hypothetical protein
MTPLGPPLSCSQADRTMYDDALAGLSFQFNPVAVQPAVARKNSSGSQAQRLRRAGRSGGGSGAALSAGASSKSVAFNLKEHRPGPAYGSPEPPQEPPQQPAAARSSRLEGTAATAPARAAPDDTAGPQLQGSAGLARLKLASLARHRAAAQAEAGLVQPSPSPPAAAAANSGASSALASTASEAAAAAEHEAAVLCDIGGLLAGCSSQLLDDPLPRPALPEHLLRGMRGLAIPPAVAHAAAPAAGAAPDAEEGGYQIAAYPPDSASSGSSGGGGQELQAAAMPGPAAADAAAAAAAAGSAAAGDGGDECVTADSSSRLAATSAADRGQLPQPPATLEEALQCLGLLPQPAAAPAGHVSSATSARLQAVQVVLAARRQAAEATELLPLVQRLRRVCMHLEFHKVGGWPGCCVCRRQQSLPCGQPEATGVESGVADALAILCCVLIAGKHAAGPQPQAQRRGQQRRQFCAAPGALAFWAIQHCGQQAPAQQRLQPRGAAAAPTQGVAVGTISQRPAACCC